jgi:hypothetical protein
MPPFSADADLPASLRHESSGFLIRSPPFPIPVQPLTSLFVGTFSVLEDSSFVSVPLRATEFGSNFGSKRPQLFFCRPPTDIAAERTSGHFCGGTGPRGRAYAPAAVCDAVGAPAWAQSPDPKPIHTRLALSRRKQGFESPRERQ